MADSTPNATIYVSAELDQSWEKVETQIETALTKIEQKAKIKIQFDTASIQKAINDLTGAMNVIQKAMAGDLDFSNASASDIKSLTAAFRDLTRATEEYGSSQRSISMKSETAGINANTTAMKAYTAEMKEATALAKNFSSAQISASPQSRYAYSGVEQEIKSLESYLQLFQQGKIEEEEFSNCIALSKNNLANYTAQLTTTAQADNQLAEAEQRAAQEAQERAQIEEQAAQAAAQAAAQEQQVSNAINVSDQTMKAYASTIQQASSMLEKFSSAQFSASPETQGAYSGLAQQMEELKASYQGLFEGTTGADEFEAAVNRLNESLGTYKAQLETTASADKEAASAAQEAAKAAEEKSKAADEAAKAAEEQAKAEEEQARAAEEASSATQQSTKDTIQYNNQMRQAENLSKSIGKSLNDWTAAQNSSNDSVRAAYEGLRQQKEAVDNLKSELESGTISAEEFKEQFSGIQANVAEYNRVISDGGAATKSFMDRLSSVGSTVMTWFSLRRVIMYAVQAMKEMVSAAIEVDSAMAQLKIVTDETEESYSNFADGIAQTAQDIGASITDLLDSSTTYARLGYNLEESSTLAEYTSMLKNVGDIEVGEAQEAVTSIVKAFDIDIDDIESVMDRLVAVGNNFPISVSEIAEGMTNASSALAAAGSTFDESVALLTAANTTIQNISRSSTGLRTIVARLRNTTTELDELGEEMTTAQYEEMISALTDANVKLTENGEFRDVYLILEDIAHAWGDLSSMQQAAIAKTVAGTRQQAVFYSLIEQFQEAEGAMETMSESAGTLMKSYDIYMDTTQRHIDTFKAAVQGMSSDLLSTDFLNFFVDLGTGIINVIDKIANLINKIGGLKTVLAGLATAFVALKWDSIVRGITNVINGFSKLGGSFATFFSQMSTAGVSFGAFTQQVNGMATSVTALPATFSTLSTSILAVTAGLVALYEIMIYVGNSSDRLRDAAQEARSEYESQKDTVDSLKEEYNNLQDQIAELEALKASGQANLAQEAELQTLYEQNSALEAQMRLEESLLAIKTRAAADATKAEMDSAQTYFDFLKDAGYNTNQALFASLRTNGILGVEQSSWKHTDSVFQYRDALRNSGGRSAYLEYVHENGNNYGATAEYAVKRYQELSDLLDEVNLKYEQNPDSKYWEKQKENLQSSLADMGSSLVGYEEEIQGNIETLVATGASDDVIDYWYGVIDDIIMAMDDVDSLAGRQQYELDTFFSRKDTDNSIAEAFQEAVDSGQDLNDVLGDLGISLSDLGSDVTLDSLEAYFREAGEYIPRSIEDIVRGLDFNMSDLFGDLSLGGNALDFTNIAVPEEVTGSWSELQNGMTAYFDGQKRMIDQSSFGKTVNSYISDINKLTDAYRKLQSGSLDASAEKELREEFQELSNYSGDLDDQIIALINDMDSDVISAFADQINQVDSAEAREQLYELMDAVLELGDVTSNFDFDIDTETEGIQNLNSAIGDSATAAGVTAEEIENLKERYQDLDGYDVSKLFETTTNGIHLNESALRDLEAAYQEQNVNDLNDQLQLLMGQYNNLSQQIETCADASRRSELYAARDSLKEQIEDTAMLASQYDGLTSSYNEWINAQNTTNQDEMYNNISNGIEDIEAMYEAGTVGYDEFRAAAQMMTDVDLSTASIDDVVAAYENGIGTMKRFFTGSREGLQDFTEVAKEVNDSLGKDWINIDDEGTWTFDFGINGEEELAAAMSDLDGIQLSATEVHTILEALQSYGWEVNLDGPYTQYMNLKTAAEEYGEVLNEITGTDYAFNVNTNSLSDVNAQIDELSEIINDNDFIVDGEFDMDVEGAEEASDLMESLYNRAEELSGEQVIMTVNTSGMEGQVYDAVRLIQNTLSAYADYKMDVDLELDTSESQAQLFSLASQIESLDASTTAKLGLDDSEFQAALSNVTAVVNGEVDAEVSDADIATIESTLSGITAEALVTAGVDSSLVDEYMASEHDSTGTVTWTNNTSAVDAYAATTKTASGTVVWSEDTSGVTTKFYATGTVTVTEKSSDANGSVHSYARGTDVTVGETGEAIVNELGEEGLIRDGVLTKIVGGMQKIFLRAGDIILNHRQLEELEKNGYVTSDNGRGRLVGGFSNGTTRAFPNGSGRWYGGASSGSSGSSSSKSTTKTSTTTTTKTTSSGNTSSSSSKSSSSSNTSSSSSTTKSTSTSETEADDFEETLDWIEIKIDRIERAIDSLDLTMSSTYKTWSTRNSALSDELSKVTDEISIQQQAYDRYMQQANSVGLSSQYQELVKNGAIDISTITDEDLSDKIKEYQQWWIFSCHLIHFIAGTPPQPQSATTWLETASVNAA